ncbi:MAG TPA: helix-turn-helix domain-containing protein [Candidatus Xenobia bacterium]|nr:helix-turn-helix domain-containing protein [Candidatus Xenobia bacterium]
MKAQLIEKSRRSSLGASGRPVQPLHSPLHESLHEAQTAGEPPIDKRELLTPEELALLLKVPKSWVYDHVRPGGGHRLPHIKLGKYLRFFATDVLHYLSAMKTANHRSRR